MATFEDYLFVKDTKWFIWGALGLLAGALVFHAGVVVGSHNRMLGGRSAEGGFEARMPFGTAGVMLPQGFVQGGHGALGTIDTVSLPTFTVITRDGNTLYIKTSSSTQLSGVPNLDALQSGEMAVIIGEPSDSDTESQINARFIRVTPPPPQQ